MNNLSQIRGQLGITQRQLANHIGWSQPRIANYETGLRSPSLSVAQKIVQALNTLGSKVCIEDVFPPQS
ncbi:TPA: helix-turn-helix transcriptional regulator [Haemophilus influenzae]|uniref:helix-turn-helix transcriptional regulator n=1 Tax=Haemophilus influenzae TaxID=727 RepID=UPI0034DA3ECE